MLNRTVSMLEQDHDYLPKSHSEGCTIDGMVNDSSPALLGSRDTEVRHQLWEAVKDKNLNYVMSDYWSPYEKFIPNDLHQQSKVET